ncbi:MAG: hypothetical protein JSV92_03970 [archaeon]|nr:MAG: hypothetical protein JSV92_03970 [archaeon]
MEGKKVTLTFSLNSNQPPYYCEDIEDDYCTKMTRGEMTREAITQQIERERKLLEKLGEERKKDYEAI